MKQPVLCAAPETLLRSVAQVMLEERVGALPVVSEEGGMVGMLTRSDLLRFVVRYAPLDVWA